MSCRGGGGHKDGGITLILNFHKMQKHVFNVSDCIPGKSNNLLYFMETFIQKSCYAFKARIRVSLNDNQMWQDVYIETKTSRKNIIVLPLKYDIIKGPAFNCIFYR